MFNTWKLGEEGLIFSIPVDFKTVSYGFSYALNITVIDRLTGENSTKQVDLIIYDTELEAVFSQTFFETNLMNNLTVIIALIFKFEWFQKISFKISSHFQKIKLYSRSRKPYSNTAFIIETTQFISYNESISKFSKLKSYLDGKVHLSILVGANIAWINLKVGFTKVLAQTNFRNLLCILIKR